MIPSTQQAAVKTWVVEDTGSLNLVARAGCGKTSTLMMVLEDIPRSQSVTILAFNKSIAEEIKLKVGKLGLRNVTASTVHAAGFKAWSRQCSRLEVSDRKVGDIVKNMTKDEHDFYGRNLAPICQLVSLSKQSGCGFSYSITDTAAWFHLADHHGLEMTEGDTIEQLVEACIPVYQQSIAQDRWKIDFDDMILAPLLHNAPIHPCDWVLVDEAQDTNAVRRALALKMMRPKTGRLIAVGDDRQAIYGFTGADADAMDLIKNELHSKVLPLTVTYRCPKAIVKEANKLVPDLEAHESAPDGTLRALPLVANGHQWFVNEPPDKSSVILCRNTKPLIEQAYAMIRVGQGCRVEGRDIGEGLIHLVNRWKRITTLGSLSDKLVEYQEREMQKWMSKGREEKAQAVEDRVQTIQVMIQQLLNTGRKNVSDLTLAIRSLFGDSKPGVPSSVVTLSTIHKSKGREWNTVYLLDRASTLPSKWARKTWQLNQEANLEYVAITRAKKELVDLCR